MIRCRLCGELGSSVKSHIIPEAFFRELRGVGEVPLLVAGKDGVPPKRAPIGVYDSGILCAPCEARFAADDSYGISVLLSQFDRYFKPLIVEEKTIAFQATDVDCNRLLRFLVSVMWRASVSGHAFYSTVNLGPLEEVACGSLSALSVPTEFNAVFSRWSESEGNGLPNTAFMNPIRERWDNVNVYRLYLGKVVAYIKVDRRPFSEPLHLLSLQSGGPCHIVSRSLARSKDLQAMRKTAVVANRNFQRLRARYGGA